MLPRTTSRTVIFTVCVSWIEPAPVVAAIESGAVTVVPTGVTIIMLVVGVIGRPVVTTEVTVLVAVVVKVWVAVVVTLVVAVVVTLLITDVVTLLVTVVVMVLRDVAVEVNVVFSVVVEFLINVSVTVSVTGTVVFSVVVVVVVAIQPVKLTIRTIKLIPMLKYFFIFSPLHL